MCWLCVWSEDILSGGDEEATQHGVTGLADGELWSTSSRVVLARAQSEVGGDTTARAEPGGFLESEHEAECGEWSDTGDFAQSFCFGVACLGQRFELMVGTSDLSC
jgi:hypothetical protein